MMNYSKNNPETIRSLFDSIAKNYDRTNSILSLCMHKRWNSALIRKVFNSKPFNQTGATLLDLCCGTGAIALEYLKKQDTPPTKSYLLDFSLNMLEQAKKQSQFIDLTRHHLQFIQADAEQIPLENHSIDYATIAYGIRNIKNPKKTIEEVFRVMRPHGTFGILELTQPKNPFIRFGHYIYLRTVLPILGKLCTSNLDAYQYLCQSIPNFIPPERLRQLLEEAGFQEVQCKSLCGGVATLFTCRKH